SALIARLFRRLVASTSGAGFRWLRRRPEANCRACPGVSIARWARILLGLDRGVFKVETRLSFGVASRGRTEPIGIERILESATADFGLGSHDADAVFSLSRRRAV